MNRLLPSRFNDSNSPKSINVNTVQISWVTKRLGAEILDKGSVLDLKEEMQTPELSALAEAKKK